MGCDATYRQSSPSEIEGHSRITKRQKHLNDVWDHPSEPDVRDLSAIDGQDIPVAWPNDGLLHIAPVFCVLLGQCVCVTQKDL
jgi:hypothetical protein